MNRKHESTYRIPYMVKDILVIFAFGTVEVLMLRKALSEFATSSTLVKVVFVLSCCIIIPLTLITWWQIVADRAEMHVIVHLLDEGVEGQNIWGNKIFLKYEDIVKIYSPKWRGLRMIYVVDAKGQTLKVTGGLNNLGQCMEYIRDHSWNIEHVDFGKIDKNAMHWNNPDSY